MGVTESPGHRQADSKIQFQGNIRGKFPLFQLLYTQERKPWKGELGKRELNHRGGLELAGIDFKESIADFF